MNICLKSAIIFCIIICVVPDVYSIKCWTCRSSYDPKCADPFDNSTLPISDCTLEKGLPHLSGYRPKMCRKIRQKVEGVVETIRDCMLEPLNDISTACIRPFDGPNVKILSCETCEYDGCNDFNDVNGFNDFNGAATIGRAVALIFAPLGLLLFK